MRVKNFVFVTAVCLLGTGVLAAQSFEKVPEAKQAASATAVPAGVSGKIAVINVQVALLNTQEGKKGVQDFQARFRPQQVELESLRKEVSEYQVRLQAGARTLSPDAQAEIQREIDKRVKKGRRLEEDLQEESQLAQNELLNRISVKIKPIIDQYAKQNNLILILPISQQTLPIYVAPGVDITGEIVKLYDQANPVAVATSSN